MADFSEIPKEIIRKIAVEHLDNQEDFESFRGVCSLWRSETEDIQYICPLKNTQLPWLMLADSPKNSYRRFYSLSKHMIRRFDLPEFDEDVDDHRRYFSSKGWLVGVSMKRARILFFDVFSSQLIKPPSVPILSFWEGHLWDNHSYVFQFRKFVFSSRPSPSSSSDFQVAMVFDTVQRIAFWRPGQKEWIKPDPSHDIRHINDVCFFRGEFYSIGSDLLVLAYGNQPRIVANLRFQGLVRVPVKFYRRSYIVELQSTLLLVIYRILTRLPENQYWTESFELVEVNVDDGKATRVEGIGDRALFVGFTSTFFVEADKLGSCSCRPNCIYFTDDNMVMLSYHSHHRGGSDMGIFSLDERRVVARFYKGPSQFNDVSPPIWVQLPHEGL